jgi:DNA-binding NarL/FixJ family response regulator
MTKPRSDAPAGLTDREVEVLGFVAEGRTSKQIDHVRDAAQQLEGIATQLRSAIDDSDE